MTRDSTAFPWLLALALTALACSKQNGASSPPPGEEPLPAVELLDQDFGRGAAPAQPEPMPGPPDPHQTISGTIALPAARRTGVSKGDTIFIAARRPGAFPGAGSLLAAQRLQADEFPLSFSLSARDAMVPGTAFEGAVNISVRVDKDGDPLTRQRGDVYGQATGVQVGTAGLLISLDSLQREDVTLATGPVLDRAGLPPGHP